MPSLSPSRSMPSPSLSRSQCWPSPTSSHTSRRCPSPSRSMSSRSRSRSTPSLSLSPSRFMPSPSRARARALRRTVARPEPVFYPTPPAPVFPPPIYTETEAIPPVAPLCAAVHSSRPAARPTACRRRPRRRASSSTSRLRPLSSSHASALRRCLKRRCRLRRCRPASSSRPRSFGRARRANCRCRPRRASAAAAERRRNSGQAPTIIDAASSRSRRTRAQAAPKNRIW